MRRLLSVLLLLPALAVVPAGVAAPQPVAPQTLRLEDGAELWTIPYAALEQFIADGTFADQRLRQLVARSGWPEDQLRVALAKPYGIELVPLARFLYSPAGVAFLQQQTRAFRPLKSRRGDLRVEGLRAAILRNAEGGTLSAMGILRQLPTDFVVELGGVGVARCSSVPCANPQQCRSVLSWLVFLPACLQAAAMNGTAPTSSGPR
mgnify:CR=1 FL=1|jgi:hypothetical protein